MILWSPDYLRQAPGGIPVRPVIKRQMMNCAEAIPYMMIWAVSTAIPGMDICRPADHVTDCRINKFMKVILNAGSVMFTRMM